MRRTLLAAVVCLCASTLSLDACAEGRPASNAAASGDANSRIVAPGVSRQRVYALLGQPMVVDRDNDRWIYPTQTIMFKDDAVVGVLESEPLRVTPAAEDSSGLKPSKAVKRGQNQRRSAPNRVTRPSRKGVSGMGPFSAVKKRFYKKPTLPSTMRRSASPNRSSLISPYQSGRYGHNLRAISVRRSR